MSRRTVPFKKIITLSALVWGYFLVFSSFDSVNLLALTNKQYQVTTNAEIRNEFLRGVNFVEPRFTVVKISKSTFLSSSLKGLRYHTGFVSDSKFLSTDLRGSIIEGVVFTNVSFEGSDLAGAHFSFCDFIGVDFTGVNLDDSTWIGNSFKNVTFDKLLKEGPTSKVALFSQKKSPQEAEKR
jgi:uncharacterized protein YjbI with pentapeptide repeats